MDKKLEMGVDMGTEGIKSIKMAFPSNAHKNREDKNERPKLKKVIRGTAVKRKKSLSKRFLETFIGEDINNIGAYILHDVLIPAAKSMIYDAFKGSLEMSLFGEKQGSRTSRDRGKSYVSYNNYASARRDIRPDISNKNRSRHNFDEIILQSRGEAEEVLSLLVDLVIDYGQATVGDLYDLVEIESNFTDNKYGWTDLSSANVTRTRDGYLLNFPKVILLD